jgi:hypothetical protein
VGLDYIRGIELEHHQLLSIMHRAFDSEDIIYSVLEYLKSSPNDLKNLAVTCSRLSGPALDILWAEQSGFGPLFMCLPRDLRKYDGRTIVSDVYHLNLDSTMLTML